jgi:uncharacterized protein YndB with AHSA1/START domain
MKEIHTEIEIQTSDERVWDLVTDFDGFPNWNPFILRAEGKLETGGKLKVILQLPDSGKMTFKPTIIKLEPRRCYASWVIFSFPDFSMVNIFLSLNR